MLDTAYLMTARDAPRADASRLAAGAPAHTARPRIGDRPANLCSAGGLTLAPYPVRWWVTAYADSNGHRRRPWGGAMQPARRDRRVTEVENDHDH